MVIILSLGALLVAFLHRDLILFVIEVVAFFGEGRSAEIFAWMAGCFFVVVLVPLGLFVYFRWDNGKSRVPDKWRKIR